MKKLKVGIIGAGGIAQSVHIPGYQKLPDQCEVVAVCDVSETAVADCQKKFGIAKAYSDYKALLADPEIDAVSVTTPNALHLEPTILALEAGKHVLCEKPLAMNASEARKIARAAKSSGKILQVALQLRFSSSARFMKQFIDAGQMGDIQYARAQAIRRRGVPHWGVFIDKEKQGGGPLIDIGVHILDLTLFLMGYPKPVVATGMTWNTLGTNPKIKNFWGDFDRSKFTVEDFAVAMIRFDNGAVVTLESSFMANAEGDPFCTQLYGTEAGATVRISGDEPVKIFREVEGQYFNMTPVHLPHVESAHHAEVAAFVDAILEGKPSPVPAENGLTLNAIFDAIYQSSESGREVEIDMSF